MKTITFECETITPMFLSGADGQTPELRPPSIKGAMRFWWRAMNGHMSLDELKRKEGEIFGNGGTKATQSTFAIVVEHNMVKAKKQFVPHRPFMQQDAFIENQTFIVKLYFRNNEYINEINNLFLLVSFLGGLGKRSRRGMGSFRVINCKEDVSLEKILECLNIVNPNYFEIKDNKIVFRNFKGEQYPFIKQIEIGRPDSQLLEKISEATHETKGIDSRAYEISLGHAFRGRFASPVYVSCAKSALANFPIITTLNAVPNRDKHLFNIGLQNDFKTKIL